MQQVTIQADSDDPTLILDIEICIFDMTETTVEPLPKGFYYSIAPEELKSSALSGSIESVLRGPFETRDALIAAATNLIEAVKAEMTKEDEKFSFVDGDPVAELKDAAKKGTLV